MLKTRLDLWFQNVSFKNNDFKKCDLKMQNAVKRLVKLEFGL
jgi:hypothetical protein